MNSIPIEPSSRAGAPFVDALAVRGLGVVRRVVAGKRLREIEDEIAIEARQRMQPLGGSVEDVEVGDVSQLDERFGDFVLDFFLVERACQRRFVGGTAAGFFRLLPTVVEDDDIQCAHSVA